MKILSYEGKLYLCTAALIALLSYASLGFIGMRTIVGFGLLMLTPFYIIFSLFECSEKEKIIFSFFTGITIVPSLVYWLGFLIPFKLAIAVVFLLLSTLAYFAWKKRKILPNAG